jgi:hypothetical protein
MTSGVTAARSQQRAQARRAGDADISASRQKRGWRAGAYEWAQMAGAFVDRERGIGGLARASRARTGTIRARSNSAPAGRAVGASDERSASDISGVVWSFVHERGSENGRGRVAGANVGNVGANANGCDGGWRSGRERGAGGQRSWRARERSRPRSESARRRVSESRRACACTRDTESRSASTRRGAGARTRWRAHTPNAHDSSGTVDSARVALAFVCERRASNSQCAVKLSVCLRPSLAGARAQVFTRRVAP